MSEKKRQWGADGRRRAFHGATLQIICIAFVRCLASRPQVMSQPETGEMFGSPTETLEVSTECLTKGLELCTQTFHWLRSHWSTKNRWAFGAVVFEPSVTHFRKSPSEKWRDSIHNYSWLKFTIGLAFMVSLNLHAEFKINLSLSWIERVSENHVVRTASTHFNNWLAISDYWREMNRKNHYLLSMNW